MSAKVVAIAGAGGFVGKAFANAFLDTGAFEIRILTRESSVSKLLLPLPCLWF
jgi:nucleoside-diphosphate-sugar epimerase